MKISARTGRTGLVITRLGKKGGTHKTGTVIMTGVRFGRKIMGDMVEESEKVIPPRSNDFMSVKNWPTAKFTRDFGYVDSETGQPLTTASAVYIAGSRIYYM